MHYCALWKNIALSRTIKNTVLVFSSHNSFILSSTCVKDSILLLSISLLSSKYFLSWSHNKEKTNEVHREHWYTIMHYIKWYCTSTLQEYCTIVHYTRILHWCSSHHSFILSSNCVKKNSLWKPCMLCRLEKITVMTSLENQLCFAFSVRIFFSNTCRKEKVKVTT